MRKLLSEGKESSLPSAAPEKGMFLRTTTGTDSTYTRLHSIAEEEARSLTQHAQIAHLTAFIFRIKSLQQMVQ